MTEKSRSERGGRRRFNLKRREACTGWLFVSPALIGFSIFTFGSILYSLYLSFTDYNLLSKPNWLGLQNYVKAFTDDQYFYPYFGNTFYFVVALVPIVLVVSLLLFAATYHTQDGFWQLGPWQILLPGAWYANLFTAFFGFFPLGFFSTDYFPLLPWLFLFWAGYFLHHLVGRGRLAPLRRSVCPPLGWMGRHSLVLYLLHQPVILGVLTVAFRLVRAG